MARARGAKTSAKPQPRKTVASPAVAARGYAHVALVLQGGGALGSYQCGVYEALHEAGIRPNWFAGTSIGAINAAILAGNAPQAMRGMKRAINEFAHGKFDEEAADLRHRASMRSDEIKEGIKAFAEKRAPKF